MKKLYEKNELTFSIVKLIKIGAAEAAPSDR